MIKHPAATLCNFLQHAITTARQLVLLANRWFSSSIPCLLLFAGSSLIMVSCNTSGGQRANTITCSTAYRSGPSVPIEDDETVIFDDNNATYRAIFRELTFHAAYSSGRENQERSLQLWVAESSSGKELFRQLYQLPPDAGPRNQFVGGHGFTGLNYAYHPTSGAELQFWCTAE